MELAKQDALDIREGRSTAVHEYYSASTMVVLGIELEDQQYGRSHAVMLAM